MNKSGIYGWKNILDDLWYVGQTTQLGKRKIHHLHKLRAGTHHNPRLQNSFTKYGEEWFQWVILEECATDMLDIREKAWISYYKSSHRDHGYNCDGGGNANKVHTPESRARRSVAQKGRKHSEETKRKMADARKTYYADPENRKKSSISATGRKFTDADKAKMASAKLGTKRPEHIKIKISETMTNIWKQRLAGELPMPSGFSRN
jgi:group I intron endonuclease